MSAEFPILIAGASDSEKSLKVYAPWDRSEITAVPIADSATIETALQTANAIHTDRNRWLSPEKRIEVLSRAAELMQERADELAIEAAREGGKPLADSRVEMARAIDSIKSCVECVRTSAGKEIPMGINAASQNRLAFTRKEPIGVVVAVSAFNHPLNLIAHQVGPAIASGCPVIVKPAQDTPLSCFRLVQIFHEAGLSEEYCQTFVTDNVDHVGKMVADERVGFFSFIGSAKVGWMLRSKLAPGARCALEHGGVAPVIVDKTVDLDDTMPLLAKGGFYHAGQVCVSVQRVYAPRGMGQEVAERLAALGNDMAIGDPTLANTDVGPLIRPKEVERVSEWVEEAKAAGAVCVSGGEVLGETQYACTVLLNPPADIRVSTQEVFGPVICVYEYDDVDDALQQANSLPFSFQASVLSRDLEFALHCNRHLNAATVMINDHTAFRVDWMPFAGLKQSGYGVGGIPYTFEDMQVEKLTVIRSAKI